METYIRNTDGWIADIQTRLTEDYERHRQRLQELTVDTSDPGEAHTRAAMIAATQQSLEELQAALRRIEEDQYGICARCQGEIPRERLEVLPQARFCVPCQQRQSG